MLFLAVLEILLMAALAILVSPLVRVVVRSEDWRGTLTREHLLLLLGISAGAGALLSLLELTAGESVSARAVNLSPWFVLACGSFCGWGFGLRVIRLSRPLQASRATGLQPSLPLGVGVSGVLASAYLAFTALDHWWFYRGQHAGVVAAQAMGVTDVECPLAIFRVDKDSARYRCPTSLVFNQRYTKPFLPWPQYQSGRSTLLKELYDEQLRQVAGS